LFRPNTRPSYANLPTKRKKFEKGIKADIDLQNSPVTFLKKKKDLRKGK